ncbi:WhiB family transcriptional regulator [Streptomyces sp. MBT49]|nr:WhiB family transcriptional regulator [Streptomyces sp. MBT49]MBK3633272.1 WhiB family transcriptional regulator [Streptomyces sp. MBT97]
MLDSVLPRRRAPEGVPHSEHWAASAACREVDPALFFPEDFGRAEARLIAEEAKSCCRRCPVVGACLEEALRRGEAFGVWGGTDAAERRPGVRQRREEVSRGQGAA